jgi:hypothetical protein
MNDDMSMSKFYPGVFHFFAPGSGVRTEVEAGRLKKGLRQE